MYSKPTIAVKSMFRQRTAGILTMIASIEDVFYLSIFDTVLLQIDTAAATSPAHAETR